jgi:hypothetical protein
MRLHFGRTGDVNLLARGRPLGPQHIEIVLHLAFGPCVEEHSECKTRFVQITDAPLGLDNSRSALVCAFLGDEEMLNSFFEGTFFALVDARRSIWNFLFVLRTGRHTSLDLVFRCSTLPVSCQSFS